MQKILKTYGSNISTEQYQILIKNLIAINTINKQSKVNFEKLKQEILNNFQKKRTFKKRNKIFKKEIKKY
jgi:hypothetical protein